MPPSSTYSSSASSSPPPAHHDDDEEVKEKFEKDIKQYLDLWDRIRDLVQKTPKLKGLLELLTQLHEAGLDAVSAEEERDALKEEGGDEYLRAEEEADEIDKRLRHLSKRVHEEYTDPVAQRVVALWDEADDLVRQFSVLPPVLMPTPSNLCINDMFHAKRPALEAYLSAALEDADEHVDNIKIKELRIGKKGAPAPYKRKRNPDVSHEEEHVREAKRRGTLLKHVEHAPHTLSKMRRGLGYRQALRYFGVGY
ncbi:hypothetical protein NBRC10512v2_007848 [Rhodotorula toruloides]|uniref:Uncharacterized protein n=1 Tax=Rhodotorula toruloides (strain NP11) TaxID=1130832 RepID=M7WJS6_RHOT1|nr:uncharacterized protein RHTO_06496 [Rhodotorula toruloides NP11]EMS18271.1 hypothetical protein RHTO_06496 [Rhodotorula toruloides NP11]